MNDDILLGRRPVPSRHVVNRWRLMFAAACSSTSSLCGPTGGPAEFRTVAINTSAHVIKDLRLPKRRSPSNPNCKKKAPSMAETSATCRNFHGKAEFPGEPETSLDVFFKFLDEGVPSPESSCGSGDGFEGLENEEEDGGSANAEESRAFWESQQHLVQATLCRTSSIESRIRQATKECLMELNRNDSQCDCLQNATGGCRRCLRRDVCDQLRRNGFDCAICKSKWRSSPDIPSGEHTYLEVVDESSPKKGAVRVIIELNFRAEFEMARACEGYNQLVGRLPEVFVGKAERLRPLIKAMCAAAKRCTKEKRIHLGPWRKHKYMQAKWLGTCQRSEPGPLPAGTSVRRAKPRASMLTFDMLEKLPQLQRTAVEVV